jgi:Arc/MetJ-type ribon-helix-helix transcriptional regulator
MSLVDVNNEIYEEIRSLVKEDKVEYPTIQNYINRTLQKALKDRKEHEEDEKLKELINKHSTEAPLEPQINPILEEQCEEAMHKNNAKKRKETTFKIHEKSLMRGK